MAKSSDALRDEVRDVETEASMAGGGDHGYDHKMGDITTTTDNSESIAQSAANSASEGDDSEVVEVG